MVVTSEALNVQPSVKIFEFFKAVYSNTIKRRGRSWRVSLLRVSKRFSKKSVFIHFAEVTVDRRASFLRHGVYMKHRYCTASDAMHILGCRYICYSRRDVWSNYLTAIDGLCRAGISWQRHWWKAKYELGHDARTHALWREFLLLFPTQAMHRLGAKQCQMPSGARNKSNKWSKNSDERPHRRQEAGKKLMWYQPVGSNAVGCSLADGVIDFLLRTPQRRLTLLFSWPENLKICPLPHGNLDLRVIRHTRVTPTNGISIGSAVFAGFTNAINRQTDTDRPRYSVCNNRPIKAVYAEVNSPIPSPITSSSFDSPLCSSIPTLSLPA